MHTNTHNKAIDKLSSLILFQPFVKDGLTEDEIAQLSQLKLYEVACMTSWTKDLSKCPLVEVTDVKKFIAQHSKNFDMVCIQKPFLLNVKYLLKSNTLKSISRLIMFNNMKEKTLFM